MLSAAGHLPRRYYSPGETVPVTGIYAIFHNDQQDAPNEAVLAKNALFPCCEDCGEEVRFSLIREAPYIFEDSDFSKSAA